MNKTEIKEYAQSLNMDLCGVSSIDRFATSPKGKHPCDTLPGCKSVIVVGVALLDGIVQANFRDFEDGRHDLKGLYGQYGYSILPNFELTNAVYQIARRIERITHEVATPCSTGPMTNGNQISLRHAAVAAGLGQFGWLGIVLSPEFGPRNRFGAILTTLELEPDLMYDGPPLCNVEKCGICTKVCPTEALSKYGSGVYQHVEIGGKTYDYCVTDMPKCFVAEHAMTKTFGGRDDYFDYESNKNPSLGDVFSVLENMPISESGLQHHESHHCGKCLSYCPAGNWNEKFHKRGLSSGAGAIKFPVD